MQITRKKGKVVLVGDVKLDFERDQFYEKEKRGGIEQFGLKHGIADIEFGAGGGNKAAFQFFAIGVYKEMDMFL